MLPRTAKAAPAKMATVAPASLSTAPFVLDAPAAAEVLAAPPAADPEEEEDEEDALEAVAAGVVAAGAEPLEDAAAVPPIGAVDWPSICDWTVALNVPLMPLILTKICVSDKMREIGLENHT